MSTRFQRRLTILLFWTKSPRRFIPLATRGRTLNNLTLPANDAYRGRDALTALYLSPSDAAQRVVFVHSKLEAESLSHRGQRSTVDMGHT